MKAFSTHSRQNFLSKRLERNGSRNQTSSPTRSFGPFEVQNCIDASNVQLWMKIFPWFDWAIFWHIIELWVSFTMPPFWDQSSSCSISYARFIEGWTEDTIQLGGWPSLMYQTTSSVRRMAELDRTRDHFSHPPSWTKPVQQMAELERSCCLHLVLAAPPPPSGLERTYSCFILIGVAIGTLRFKNHKNSFSRRTFGLIV